MAEKPLIPLAYRSPAIKAPRVLSPLLLYFAGGFLGSLAAIATLFVVIAARPGQGEPGDPGWWDAFAVYFGAFLVLLSAVRSFIAACIFRGCCGRLVRRTSRFIVFAGSMNGFFGFGILIAGYAVLCITDPVNANLGLSLFVLVTAIVVDIAVLPMIMSEVVRKK